MYQSIYTTTATGKIKQSTSVTLNHRYNLLNQTSSCDMIAINTIGEYKFQNEMYFTRIVDNNGCVHLSNNEADLFACGKNDEDARKDLRDELDFAWKEYVLRSSESFHQSALSYREWLINNVEGPGK